MSRTEVEASQRTLLLDTHVWIWLMNGAEGELSSSTVAMIEEAGGRSEVVVSAISVWEVAMLEAKRRITLSRSVQEWVGDALTASGLRLVDLSPAIALESARLPGDPHGDPADRIIMATGRVLGATLVTCDERMLAYGAGGHVHTRNGRSGR
jgi:PIN domain nuclease of toxin-antitoxin system